MVMVPDHSLYWQIKPGCFVKPAALEVAIRIEIILASMILRKTPIYRIISNNTHRLIMRTKWARHNVGMDRTRSAAAFDFVQILTGPIIPQPLGAIYENLD